MSVLPWYALFTPLLASAIIILLTQRARRLSALISIAAVLASFLCSCFIFAQHHITAPEIPWIDFSGIIRVPIAFTLDDLSKTMLLVVTGIAALIHIYSLGYMRADPGESRYFAGLSFFTFAMLGIVLANNFVMMFIFWELVGVSSYLLIGHWFERDAAAEAAKKAFIVNRIGDFGFMIGILMVWAATGSVIFDDIAPQLSRFTANPAFLTLSVLLIFCGAVGKSAQFPLHVWLPDAMEGPTPVSALIHAATMVAAGIYMLARVGFLVQASTDALRVISWIGTITALLAALIATQQDDIKRILAYSTLSQLGYMVMAVGLGSNGAAMFHLFTHAFFKALLFLSAGAVIIALHHEQNIWRMGGQGRNIFLTFVTFAAGMLALIGCPPFSGFFSKDAILALAWDRSSPIFTLAVLTAFLTAFYMMRLLVVVFFGKARSEVAQVSSEGPTIMLVPLFILAVLALVAGFRSIAGRFLLLPPEASAGGFVSILALGAMLAGAVLAGFLYRGRTTDPISIRLLRKKFYLDEFYEWIVSNSQERLAQIAAFIDRWIIDAGAVRGLSGGTWGVGAVLRLMQVGNLQAYAFIFGLGVIWVIYFTLFRS